MHLPRVRPVVRRLAATLAAALAVTGAVTLAACGSDRSTATTGETGGTLVAVSAREPSTLLPPFVDGTEGMQIVNAIFDRLADIGPELQSFGDVGFRPRLASSWRWANDSLSIAFTLDSLARWHDGRPVRAEDVRFTFRVYTSDSVGAEVKPFLGNIDSVTVRDARTAVFWFKRRLPQQFYDATQHMYVLPSHLLESIPLERLAEAPFGRAPVGSGRFRFVSWQPEQRIEIDADTTNYRGRAGLDRVIWSYVADFGAATVKLFAGEADFYENVRPENLPQLARSPSLRLVNGRDVQYYFLGFNARDPMRPNEPHPAFADSLVRRALSMGVDRLALVRNVFDSLGDVALGPAPRALIPDTTAFRQIPYDVAGARALLDSAGWRDGNSDGVREKNGVPLAFDLLTPSSSAPRRRYGVLLQEQFRAIGAKVTPVELPSAEFGKRVYGQRKYDTFIGAWMVNSGLGGLRQTWMSTGRSNDVRYTSRRFDALVDSALTTVDSAASRRYWGQAFDQIVHDAPAIWLYEPHTPLAVHRRFLLPPLRADGWWLDLADWRLDPKQPRLDRDRIPLGARR